MKNYKVKIEMDEFIIKDETKANDITLIASQGQPGEPGQPGRDGHDGVDGYTPIKGVDYFTEEDIDDLHIPVKLSDLQNDTGFISSENDPVFLSSVASGITTNDITNWNNKSEFSGNYNDLSNKPTIPDVSNFITKDVNDLTNYTLTSNLSSVATSNDYDDLDNKPTLFSGSYDDLTDKPEIPPKMTILKYGISTWNDFISVYSTNSVVYCRASSNSNPASGSQTRMAFMAYVNNETNPTEVEFQYYRSVSSHSDSQQGDQVFVYKLNKTNGWSVTTRNAFTKIVAGTGLKSSYSNGVLTISLQ